MKNNVASGDDWETYKATKHLACSCRRGGGAPDNKADLSEARRLVLSMAKCDAKLE